MRSEIVYIPQTQCNLHSHGTINCPETSREEYKELPNPALNVPEGTYKAVASSFVGPTPTVCAIRTDNQVVCWGQINGEMEF